MAKTAKGRRPRSEGTAPTTQSHASDSPAKVSGKSDRLGERVEFECPLCGKCKANATFKLDRDGHPRWFVSCWSGSCDSGAEYLDLLAEAWELPEGSTPEDLAAAARRRAEAGPGGSRRRDRRAEPEPLPTPEQVEAWADALPGSPGAEYLVAARRIRPDVLAAARVGWDGRQLVFPMFNGAGEVVAAKRRLPRAGAQMRSWAGNGRPWPLYPRPDRAGWVLLVAGELDALRARSAGLPASSVTLGAGYWRDDWTADLEGRRVVVAFDVGEEKQARERVDALRAAGINALWRDLRKLGLRAKSDISDYLNGGGDPAELRAPRYLVKRRRTP